MSEYVDLERLLEELRGSVKFLEAVVAVLKSGSLMPWEEKEAFLRAATCLENSNRSIKKLLGWRVNQLDLTI
jgi:hypothetical protein